MSPVHALLFAFLIGCVCGLRTFTGPATVAWGAHLRWLKLGGTIFAFMGSIVTVAIITLLALAELVMDKLPSTPSRLAPRGLSLRVITGALSGASAAAAGSQMVLLGAVLGIVGAVAAAFAGNKIRGGLVKALKVPDYVVAVLEDAVAIGSGLLIVSRFQ
jgi:uncharacterized membrane protein